MQTLKHLGQVWQAILGKSKRMRHAYRWLLPVVMMALVVGLRSAAVEAQDRVSAQFVLRATNDPKLQNLCIGESFQLPVTLSLQTITSVGAGELGTYTIRSAQLTLTVANPSVVSAVQGAASGPVSEAPFTTHLNLTGQEAGSTTISITATVNSSVVVSLEEEVALPLTMTSLTGPISVSVRVIPCEYRVNINSIWSTTMFGADSILIGVARNLQLKGLPGELLQFDPEP